MKTYREFINEQLPGVMKYGKKELEADRKEYIAGLSAAKKKMIEFFLKHSSSAGKQIKLSFLPRSTEGILDHHNYPGSDFKGYVELFFKSSEKKTVISFYKKYWREAEMWEAFEEKPGKPRAYFIYDEDGNGKGLEN